MWEWASLGSFAQELRQAFRSLHHSRSFSALAILILAIGIAANTSLFTVVHTVLLRPLPYKDPDRLAFLWTAVPKVNNYEGGSAYLNFLDWRAQSHAFVDMMLYRQASLTLTGGDTEPKRVGAALIPDNFFSILGIAPMIGRAFTAEDVESRAPLVIVSHGLWQRALGGSPGVVGRMLEVEGKPLEIIGVMPAFFQFPARETQLWVAITEPWTDHPWWAQLKGWRWTKGVLDVVGRMRPGISLAEAQTEMSTIARRLEQQYPETNAGHTVRVVPLGAQMTMRVRRSLLVLSGAVAFVLLIACANVASLVIARGAAREREIAVRMALGASRGRVVGQLLTESLLIALAAGALGLLLASWGVRLLVSLAPDDIPRLSEVGIHPQVLLFTLGLSLLAGTLAGLGPALRVSQRALVESLKVGGATGSLSPHGLRTQRMLVAAEFALGFVLLAGAGVLIRSFLAIQAVDLGFQPERLLTMRVSLPAAKGARQRVIYYDEAIQRVAAIPGVRAAGASENFFIIGEWPKWTLTLGDGRTVTTQWDWSTVAGQYFQAIGLPLVRGRWFHDGEGRDAPSAILINETMARQFWPEDDAIGRRFKVGDADSRNPWLTVVGVVKDIRRHGRERPVMPEFFYPHSVARSLSSMELVVQTSSDPLPLAAHLASEIRSVDRTAILESVRTVERQLGDHASRRRFQTLLLTLFSAIALALAAFGIYGVMYCSVAQRSQEIGIRMALGARERDVLIMVLGQGLMLCGIGMGVGLASAFALTRLLSGMLFGVSATDGTTFAGVCLLLTGAALLASYLPARRASRVDPTVTLRYQ